MKNFRLLLMFAMISVLTLALAACADDSNVDEAASGGDGAEGAGSGDLVISEMSDIVSLDPHGSNDVPSSNVRSNIYETLTTLDENMEVQPGLATEWEEVDENTWRFTLAEGVTFHDGSEFNAEVVKANLDRIVDPNVASPRMFLYEMVENVEVIDDHTVEITTEYPFAPLLAHLSHDAGGMISEEVINADLQAALDAAGEDMTAEEYVAQREESGEVEVGDGFANEVGNYIADNAVGTGFFALQSRDAGSQVVLERYEDYHGDPAELNTVTFKVVPETGARLAELESGSSHIVGKTETNNVDRVDSHPETYLNQQPLLSLSYVGFNTEKEPLNDPLVRQAISYATDREAIIEGIYNGVGAPARGPLAPDVFGYDENAEGIEYDLDRAKELMAEAGHEDGFSLEILTNDSPERVDTAIFLQEALQEINIDVDVQQREWGAYLEETAAGEHDMYVLGWSTVTGDADYGLYSLFHSSMHGDPGNRSFLSDDQVDELLEAGRQETDPDERLAIYSELQTLLAELEPQINIHHQDELTGVRNEVENFEVDALGIYQLHDVTINQ
ncbi:glutathione ABC transporter substrate-binding protein [Corticicoccus populi]|uniref:Glutathione ABC transporter substrate-binding protein n=1 Tax=Corticicoccus populi TaxID=1812821 RepID=A0ABW5WV72_9STAP